MDAFSPSELHTEIAAALADFSDREREFWAKVRIEPVMWKQYQYPGDELVWVVAVMGGNCLYNNHVEEGWGWGKFQTWGEVSKYHWQQDEIQTVMALTLEAIDKGYPGPTQ